VFLFGKRECIDVRNDGARNDCEFSSFIKTISNLLFGSFAAVKI